MTQPPDLSKLGHAEKDALIAEKDALIVALNARILALEARIEELTRPPKTPNNSSRPPSQGQKPNQPQAGSKRPPRKSRPGVGRSLHPHPDRVIDATLTHCPHCRAAFPQAAQTPAISNILARARDPLLAAAAAIRDTVLVSQVVCSDETSVRVSGKTWWEWVFVGTRAATGVVQAKKSLRHHAFDQPALMELLAVRQHVGHDRDADRTTVLRAMFIIAEAWSVFCGGTPTYEAAMIGTKISGSPTPSTMRVCARNQKPRSAYV